MTHAPSRPPLWLSLIFVVAVVAVVAYSRLFVFSDVIAGFSYSLPLLLFLWDRRRLLLWVTAAALLAIMITRYLVLLPPVPMSSAIFRLMVAMQVCNILVPAVVIDAVIRLRDRLDAQRAALFNANQELEASNEELAAREEEILQQNEELQSQTEELEQQTEELRTQTQELQELAQEVQRRERTLAGLLEITGPSGSEDQMLERIAEMAPDLLGSDAFAAAVVERHGDTLHTLAAHGLQESLEGLDWANSITALAVEKNQTVFVRDLSLRPDLHVPACEGGQARSAIATPLHLRGVPSGALKVYSRAVQDWTDEQARLLAWLADQCEHAWEALRLRSERQQALEELEALNQQLEARVAERTAEADRRAAQLRALAAQLTYAEQRERRRLAQTLHDHLQQLLVAAKMRLSTVPHISDPKLVKVCADIDSLLQQSIDTSRSLTVELIPPILYERGLGAALQWLSRRVQEKHGLTVGLDMDEADRAMAEDVLILLFQSVQELLFNVVKHADAPEARVYVRNESDGFVHITVEDRGRGFDPARLQQSSSDLGFGLFSMQERLMMVGGQMRIDSAPGNGTRVVLRAPLGQAPSRGNLQRLIADAPASKRAATVGGDGSPTHAGIRVLIADDHQILREGLAGLLRDQSDINVIGQASDGQNAVELARQLRPDVIIMDISMPRLNGIDATRAITGELPSVRVIGMSMHDHEDVAAAMRQAGAAQCLTKGCPADLLISAIRNSAPTNS